MLTGERPGVNDGVAALLRSYGFDDFVAYVVWVCERALERGVLPHTNLGVLERAGLGAPARGDGVAGVDARVGQPPTWSCIRARRRSTLPVRLQTIQAAGELRIPFTSGVLVGIGESLDERVAALEALASVHERHGPSRK